MLLACNILRRVVAKVLQTVSTWIRSLAKELESQAVLLRSVNGGGASAHPYHKAICKEVEKGPIWVADETCQLRGPPQHRSHLGLCKRRHHHPLVWTRNELRHSNRTHCNATPPDLTYGWQAGWRMLTRCANRFLKCGRSLPVSCSADASTR